MNKGGRPTMTKDWPRISVRIPPLLHDKLRDAALTDMRSINSEVIMRLIESFQEDSDGAH